jgi:hypothetical protein
MPEPDDNRPSLLAAKGGARRVTAADILTLLEARHRDDVFIRECKDGPTHEGSHRRLDAWAMKRSWAHPAFHGYEIKVSRGDWLRDSKLADYLPMCSDLWLVAPKAIAYPEELPTGVGLLEVASTGNRLVTRRKAVHRDIPPHVGTLLYILMCRARIDDERSPDRRERARQAAEWLAAGREERRKIGTAIQAELSRAVLARTSEFEERAAEAERRAESLQHAAAVLQELGIDPASSCALWTMKRRMREALGDGLLDSLREAQRALAAAEAAVITNSSREGEPP